MAGREDELTTLLRERDALPSGTKILAAWNGFLLELSGTDAELSAPQVAILGITARTGHLLSRGGVVSFDLNRVRRAWSPRLGLLRFSVVREGRPPIEIGMAVDGALAIAGQLMDWRVPSAVPAPANRRPPAKRRIDPARAAQRVGA